MDTFKDKFSTPNKVLYLSISQTTTLANNCQTEYYLQAQLGTPPQNISLRLNTNPTSTVIASSLCEDKYNICNKLPPFHVRKSSSIKVESHIVRNNLEWKAYLATDIFTLMNKDGGNISYTMTFYAMANDSMNVFGHDQSEADCFYLLTKGNGRFNQYPIYSTGFISLNKNQQTSQDNNFISELLKNNIIEKGIIGIRLDPPKGERKGELILGDYNQSYNSGMLWTKMTDPKFSMLLLTAIGVHTASPQKNISINMNLEEDTLGKNMTISSTYSPHILKRDYFLQIAPTFPTPKDANCSWITGKYFHAQYPFCNLKTPIPLNQYPDIWLQFNKQWIILRPIDYISMNENLTIFLFDISLDQPELVLGNYFLRNYYHVIDYVEGRFGFSKIKSEYGIYDDFIITPPYEPPNSNSLLIPIWAFALIIVFSIIFLVTILGAYFQIRKRRKRKKIIPEAEISLIPLSIMGSPCFNRSSPQDGGLHGTSRARDLSPLSQKSLDKYEVLELLGDNRSGEVQTTLVSRISDGEFFVRKTIPMDELRPHLINRASREAHFLHKLSHPNVIKIIEHYIDSNKKLNLILEYAQGGDMSRFMRENLVEGRSLEEDNVIEWMLQMISGLNHLHTQGILHRNIKPNNILIMEDLTLRICDLGIGSNIKGRKYQEESYMPTILYAPPEFFEQKYTHKIDVWALGIVFYELCMHLHPFSQYERDIRLLRDGIRFCPIPIITASYSDEIKEVIYLMLEKDHLRRIELHDARDRLLRLRDKLNATSRSNSRDGVNMVGSMNE